MPKIQESAENYLETILVLKERNGTVRSVDIAAEMGFSKPSVSVAMRNLREQDCITMGEDGLISLTEKGRKIAESVYERHRHPMAGLSGSVGPGHCRAGCLAALSIVFEQGNF